MATHEPVQAFISAQSCFRYAKIDDKTNPHSAQIWLNKGLSRLREYFGSAALSDAQLNAAGVGLDAGSISAYSRVLALDCLGIALNEAVRIHEDAGSKPDWRLGIHAELIVNVLKRAEQNLRTLGLGELTRQIVTVAGADPDKVQAVWATVLKDVPIIAQPRPTA